MGMGRAVVSSIKGTPLLTRTNSLTTTKFRPLATANGCLEVEW